MIEFLSTFSFYQAKRKAHFSFLSCEFLAESRAPARKPAARRVPSNEYQFTRGCAAIMIARVLKQYPELPRDSASTIPGKAPIRARKPKSGSREEIITWARSALDLAPSSARNFSTHCLYGSLLFDISNNNEAFSTAYPRQTMRDLVGHISPTGKNHDDDVIVTGK